MSGKVSELESHLGFWLRFVSNHVSTSFQRRIEERGVTVSEWVALRLLFQHGELTPMALVDALGMTKGAVSKVLAKLGDKGLIERASAEHDRRAQRITLSGEGRKLVPRLARIADENDEAFFGHLSERQREALLNTMMELVRVHGLREIPVE